MISMIIMTIVSIALMYAGMELMDILKVGAFAFIYLAVNLFLVGILTFAMKDLGFNVPYTVKNVYTILLSITATIFIVRSCSTTYIVKEY